MSRYAGLKGLTDNKKYYQHNYIEAVKLAVPALYDDTDTSVYGMDEEIQYAVLGKILRAAGVADTLVDVSSYPLSSLQEHFILRNRKTKIDPYLFNNKIVKAFGVDVKNFTNIEDYKDFVSGTLLPNIRLNFPTDLFVTGVTALDSTVTTASAAHSYLIQNLSWLYFLNTAGPTGGVDPSAGVLDTIVSGLYLGGSVGEASGMGLLFKNLWDNRESTTSAIDLLPQILRSTDATVSSDIYASGTQLRDRLVDLVGVWYKEDDDSSDTLDTYLDLFFNTGYYASKQAAAGPFSKFLKAVSYAFYDVNSVVDDLSDLIDIEKCPPQFLQFLASLVGWKLMTGDVDRWRAQLRHAIFLYKQKGTRQSLEDAVSLVFPNSGFNPATSANMVETWESFLPRQLYYLIATESKVLNDPAYRTDAGSIARQVGIVKVGATAGSQAVALYDIDNHDNNYRFATDYALSALNNETSSIVINGTIFSSTTWADNFKGFTHRGSTGVPVPPWENDRFYENCRISDKELAALPGILSGTRTNGGLEIPQASVASLITFLDTHSYNSAFMEGHNAKWKYFTSSLQVPFNLDGLVASADSNSLSLTENWSSKSSIAISEIAISDFNNYSFDGMKIALGDVMITLQDIFRQFAPFHSVIRLLAKDTHTDKYLVVEFDDGLCLNVVVENSLNWVDPDLDNHVIASYISSGVKTSPFHGVASSVLVSATTYTGIPRTANRRRNLKYNLPSARYRRDGFSPPVPFIFGSTSATPYDTYNISGLSGINTTEYIPLGFNFSSGEYWSTTGIASAIYDASNDLGLRGLPVGQGVDNPPTDPNDPDTWTRNKDDINASFYGIDVSNTFPFRAIYPSGLRCEAPVTRRDGMHGVRRAIVDATMRRGETVDSGVNLSEQGFRNFKFGTDFIKAYYDYITLYDKTIQTRSSYYGVNAALNRDVGGGGLAFQDHAYGPIVYNSTLGKIGRLPRGVIDSASATYDEGNLTTFGEVYSWKSVIANADSLDSTYTCMAGSSVVLEDPFFTSSNEFSRPQINSYGPGSTANSNYFKYNKGVMPTLLDGVEIWGNTDIVDPENLFPSYVVYNYISNSDPEANRLNYLGVDDTEGTDQATLSFFTGPTQSTMHPEGESETFARFPLRKTYDYSKINNWKYPVSATDILTDTTSLVLFKGVECRDANRDPAWNGAGAYPDSSGGYISVSAVGRGDTHRTNYLYANVSGDGTLQDSDSALIQAKGITDLIPGHTYNFNVESYKNHTSASAVTNVNFYNKTHPSWWNGSAWTTSPYTITVSGGHGEFKTYTTEFSPSSVFSPADEYQIDIYPLGPKNTASVFTNAFAKSYFKTVEIIEASSSDFVNILAPDREYEITIRARAEHRFRSGTPQTPRIGLRISTDMLPVPFDPRDVYNGGLGERFRNRIYAYKEGLYTAYGYQQGSWVDIDSLDKNGWLTFSLASPYFQEDPNDPNWLIYKFLFNTKNSRTDYNRADDAIVRRGKEVHHADTNYFIDVCKLDREVGSYITLDQISIKDLTYEGIINDYTFEELKDIFSHFTSLTDGRASRNATNSSSTYQLSGGSRDYYLEQYGGFSGLGVNTSSIASDGVSGVVYNITDD